MSHLTWNSLRHYPAAAATELPGNELATTQSHIVIGGLQVTWDTPYYVCAFLCLDKHTISFTISIKLCSLLQETGTYE
jgi:hypothetical protein